MAKKKIDEYITIPVKEHENNDFVKTMAFEKTTFSKDKDTMPIYKTPSNDVDDDKDLSNEEE
jgi:hypothetical protein